MSGQQPLIPFPGAKRGRSKHQIVGQKKKFKSSLSAGVFDVSADTTKVRATFHPMSLLPRPIALGLSRAGIPDAAVDMDVEVPLPTSVQNIIAGAQDNPVNPQPANVIMARRRSRRRPRVSRAALRRGRRRLRSTRGRRMSRFRRRTKGRRSYRHSRLRLYPGGFPQTHLVKLRAVNQTKIYVPAGKWGYITFHPAEMLQPFKDMRIAVDTSAVGGGGTHTLLKWTDKATSAAINSADKQPYGYDHWLLQSAVGAQYRHYQVRKCTILVQFVPNTAVQDGLQFYGGFARISDESTSYGQTFLERYANIDDTEVVDMLNTKVIKQPKIITKGGTGAGGVSQSFLAVYNQALYKKHLKRVGVEMSDDFKGSHGVAPTINPEIKFIIADLAEAEASETSLNCIITIDFVVQLSGGQLGQESTT